MDDNRFGKYLREQRKKRGLTIRDLEAMSGVSNAHLSYMETGKRRPPSPDTLQKLAGPLGVEYRELMAQAGHVPHEPTKGEDTGNEIDDSTSNSLLNVIPLFERLVPGMVFEEQHPSYYAERPGDLGTEDAFYMCVPDDSLAGIGLSQGIRVLVARRAATNGDVCVCSTRSQIVVRRVFYVDGLCILQGMGRENPPVVCEPDEFSVFGVVVRGEIPID